MAQALRAGFLFLPQVCWGKLVGFCSCQERNSRATHVAPQAVCAKYELRVSQEGESESGSQPVLGSHLGASTRAMPGWPRALRSDGFELSSLSGRSQVVLLIERKVHQNLLVAGLLDTVSGLRPPHSEGASRMSHKVPGEAAAVAR